MRAIILSGTVIAATIFSVTTAQAQGPAIRVGGYYPSWHRHSSTYEEGVLRGWASIGRALGEYRYNSSLALINREEALSRNLDNREKYVRAYFSTKRMNDEYRAQKRGPRRTQEDIARVAKEQVPEHLSAGEYEPALGKLYWPAVFDQEEFSAEREAIDRLIAERTVADSGLGSANEQAITQLIGPMKAKLKDQIRSLSVNQYLQAKNFLSSLEYEVRSPMDVRGVAVR